MSAVIDEIRAVGEKFTSCYNSGNMKALSELYTEDCKILPPGADVQKGRAAVEAMFKDMQKAGAKTVKVEIVEVGPLGSTDFAFEHSNYTFYKEDDSIFDKGKYLAVQKKVNGTWLFYTDSFNSNTHS